MVLASSAVMLFLLPYVLFSTFLKLFLTCKQESGSSATDAAGLMWDYVTSTSLTSTSSCRYLFFSDVIMNMEISLACEPTCFLSLLTLVLLASACRHTHMNCSQKWSVVWRKNDAALPPEWSDLCSATVEGT